LRSRGVLAVDRAIIIAHDVALGLGAAHRRGIVHRDVKPQNVLVGKDGSIKLTDFGIASVYKDINAERLTTTGMTLGTVQYYAPEQAQGEIVNPAADVYALGIVMYEMLTGRTPFDGDTPVAVAMQHIQDLPTPPTHLNPNIPAALEEIIMRCLEKVPEIRFRDGSTLARALELLGEAEIDERVPGPVTPVTLQSSSGANNYNQYAAGGAQRPSTSSPNNVGGPTAYMGPGTAVNREPDPLILPNQAPTPVYNNSPLTSAATRPYQRGTIPRSGTVNDQRDSRFASIITVLILLATLLLLGFSVYLAAELNFIHIPGLGAPAALTPPIVQFPVPDLKNLSYQEAKIRATGAGFNIDVPDNITTGVVVSQDPAPPALAPKGSNIRLKFGPAAQQTVIVPNGLVGNSLTNAEQILRSAGITWTIQADGTNAGQAANTVSKVLPTSGSSIPKGSAVILYVVNYTNGSPVVTPNPTPIPTQDPTAKPTQDPTAKPSPDPVSDPTPTADPTATSIIH
jgi:serine/threonine-protein kinase